MQLHANMCCATKPSRRMQDFKGLHADPETRAHYPDNVLHAPHASAPRASHSNAKPRARSEHRRQLSGSRSRLKAQAARHMQCGATELGVAITSTTTSSTPDPLATGAEGPVHAAYRGQEFHAQCIDSFYNNVSVPYIGLEWQHIDPHGNTNRSSCHQYTLATD